MTFTAITHIQCDTTITPVQLDYAGFLCKSIFTNCCTGIIMGHMPFLIPNRQCHSSQVDCDNGAYWFNIMPQSNTSHTQITVGHKPAHIHLLQHLVFNTKPKVTCDSDPEMDPDIRTD